jgi:hypothetical protein
MDQDDPEKRVADLEHQLADQKCGADLPLTQPPQPANAASATGSDAPKPTRIGAWTRIVAFLGIFCGVGGLMLLRPVLLPDTYGYLLGTPTTATIDHCVLRSGTCDGRWSLGGVSQTGSIQGVYDGHDRAVGSQVDVHVRGATAYTARYARLIYLTMSGGLFALAMGLVLWWSAWRKFKIGSWPWSRRPT